MKILRHGNCSLVTTIKCECCECEYEVETEDWKKDRVSDCWCVWCPECNYIVKRINP